MKLSAVWPATVVFAVFAVGCGGDSASGTPAPSPTAPPSEAATATPSPAAPSSTKTPSPAAPSATATPPPEAPSATATPSPAAPSPTATPSPSPTPEVARHDIRATRLVIPAIGIDSEVLPAETVPYVYVPVPGCPPGPDGAATLAVPNQGIATPEERFEGLESKVWIFGHSRWAGVPGVFFSLQDVSPGDEVLVDGVDRATGEALVGQRYVVSGIYLTDKDSGDALLNADDASEMSPEPVVILQTSVRERGAGRPWIMDRSALLARAENLVQGDLDDPCKYLLLFVTAEAE